MAIFRDKEKIIMNCKCVKVIAYVCLSFDALYD